MNLKKMKSDLKRISMIDYSKIEITDDLDIMMRNIITQHIKFQESRLIIILRELLTKVEFESVQTLLRANNKSVLGVFLKERNIEITMDRREHSSSFVVLNLYINFYKGSDAELVIPIFGSEDKFKENLVRIKNNYGEKSDGIK